MVPVESTALALLALCTILLAVILFFSIVFPRDAPVLARFVIVPVLGVVVVLAIYALLSTRIR